MTTLRIGSLCSGYGGLDMAVMDVLDASVAWHAQYDPDDRHQWAAQILAHHWPAVPNHCDITTADWSRVEPVDVLTAGFPCQDLSLAGKRAGMREGNRSGLWFHVTRAIEQLRPRLVVIENVPGILTSAADGDMEPCPWCLGDAGGEPPLRALGAVLADLARLGFDAEWTSLGAADVGAPHRRRRVFLIAWPADAPGVGHGTPGRRASEGFRPPLSEVVLPLLPTPTATPYGNNQSPSSGAAVRPSLDSLAPALLPTPTTQPHSRNRTANRAAPKESTNTKGSTLLDVFWTGGPTDPPSNDGQPS